MLVWTVTFLIPGEVHPWRNLGSGSVSSGDTEDSLVVWGDKMAFMKPLETILSYWYLQREVTSSASSVPVSCFFVL